MLIHSLDFRYVTKKWHLLTLHCNSRLKFHFISDPQLVGQYQSVHGKTCNYTIRSIAVEHVKYPPLRHASATSHQIKWKLLGLLFIGSNNIILHNPEYTDIKYIDSITLWCFGYDLIWHTYWDADWQFRRVEFIKKG